MKKRNLFFYMVIMSCVWVVGTGCTYDDSEATASASYLSAVDQTLSWDDLIDEVCQTSVRCDNTLDQASCVEALSGEAGRQIADNFGLEDFENEFLTSEIAQGIEEGWILFDANMAQFCLDEMTTVCQEDADAFSLGDYENVENVIPEEGACSQVLVISGYDDNTDDNEPSQPDKKYSKYTHAPIHIPGSRIGEERVEDEETDSANERCVYPSSFHDIQPLGKGCSPKGKNLKSSL